MRQNLTTPSRKVLLPLLSLGLLWQTACDSDQAAQDRTKQEVIKSTPTTTVAPTFEELIEGFKQQGDEKTGDEKNNHEAVLKALEVIKEDKAKIHEKISLKLSAIGEVKASALFGALIEKASPQLLQELLERGADFNETVGKKGSSLLTLVAIDAPRQSIEWMIGQGAKLSWGGVPNYSTVFALWSNEKLSLEDKGALLIQFTEQKLVDIKNEKDEESENLLGAIVLDPGVQEKPALIKFLLSKACEKTEIKELLYMENKKGKIPYEIAIDKENKELAELFKKAMDHNRKTIKVNGEENKEIADILK
ncbi:MAG: hypothetical protein AAFP88_02130 [Bacteroidota bacterium]